MVSTGAEQDVDAEPRLNAAVTASPTTRVTVPVRVQRRRPVKCVLSFAFLLVVATLVVLVVWITTRDGRVQVSPSTRPPHIVFILADDLGWADLSYNGNPQIRTPNIDALAWNGVRLTRLYHQPLCTPSRAAIMSGLYPIHTGMQHFVIRMSEPRGLPLNLKLLPEWLNDLGYTSYMIGKWHLGFHKTEYTPTNRGFLSHVGSWGGACEYTTHERAGDGSTDYGLDFRRNSTLAPEDSGRYYTEVVTEEAVSLIKNHRVDKPMFLYVAHLAPHCGSVRVPLEAPAEYREGYDFIGPRNRTFYAGGDASKLAGIDGVSHLQSIDDPLAYPPRTEVLLNIDPIEGNEAIIQDSYKLVYGAFPGGTSQWLSIPGKRLPVAQEAEQAHQSCTNSITYKILAMRGFSPNCGEGGGVYSTPVKCGNRNSSKAPCDSTVAPCLYDINTDPCEYNDIANENSEMVQKLQARIATYKKGALNPSNIYQDPSSFPHNHGGAWVSWKDEPTSTENTVRVGQS